MEKVNYNLLFLGADKFHVSYGPFLKTAALPPMLPKPTPMVLRRHHNLRTCILGLDGILVHTHIDITYIQTDR
jgi:hypothetical protein